MIRQLFDALMRAYGPQRWWPGDTGFEVALGAVLVQNAAWRNAEKALAELRGAGALSAPVLLSLPETALHALLRSSGTFRVKSERARALAAWWVERAAFAPAVETVELRSELLSIKGIGPETADCIVLYVFGRPVFVVDAYARRLLGRAGVGWADAGYEKLRARLEEELPEDPHWLGEAHAVCIAHGQATCRRNPRCSECEVRRWCVTGRVHDQ
ncbi:MAG: endonuclease [Pseudomonadota bacterium]